MKFVVELNLTEQPDVPPQFVAASALESVRQSLLTPRDVSVQPIRGQVLDGCLNMIGDWTLSEITGK